MGLDVLGLATVIGGVATAVVNLLHGKDDGKLVESLTQSIDKGRDATALATTQLNAAFQQTQVQLGRLIDVVADMARQGTGAAAPKDVSP